MLHTSLQKGGSVNVMFEAIVCLVLLFVLMIIHLIGEEEANE